MAGAVGKRPGFAAAAAHFEDGMARICRLYGLSPLAGRLYAILFLSADPLSLDALVDRTGAAKSTVSVALRKLLAVRVARRLPQRSGRRDFYEVVADPRALLADWSRLFFQPELEMWRASGHELTQALAQAPDAPSGQARAALRERVEVLRDFAERSAEVLERLARPARPGRRRRETR